MKKSVPVGKSCLYLLCLLGLLLAVPPTAQAVTTDWSSTATSTSWTLAGNWLGGVPANSLETDIARFNQTSYAFQPAAPALRKINGLIIGDGTTATASLTNTTGVQVGRLAVGSGGIVMNANSGPVVIGLQTLNSGINLGANQSWANNSSSLLTVHQIGNINDADTTTPYTVTINGSGSGGLTIDSLILNGGAVPQANGSPVALIINTTGSHVTTISGANNTFTGGVTLMAGTLSVAANNNALGSSANTVTIQGGTLDVAGNVVRAATSSFKLDGDFIFTSSGGVNGQYDMNGTNTLGGNRTITVNSGSINITALGDDGNGYSLTKTGTALMRLKGAGTYSGDTKVTGGELKLFDNNLAIQNSAFDTDGTGLLTFNPGVTAPTFGGLKGAGNLRGKIQNGSYDLMASLTLNPGAGKTLSYSGIITNTTSGLSLVKTGAGTQILSGTNSYAGTTTVSDGTLLINGKSSAVNNTWTVAAAATLGGSGTIGGAVTVQSGGILRPGLGGTDSLPLTLSSALSLSGTCLIALNRTNASTAATVTLTSATLTRGGILTVTNVGGPLQANDTFTLFSATSDGGGNFSATNLPPLGTGTNWWTTNNYKTLLVNKAPTAGNATYNRAAGEGIKNILITDVLTNVSGVSVGQTITLAGIGSAAYGTASINGSYMQYSPTGSGTNNDSFTYTINDGRGGTATGTIYLNISQVTGQDSGSISVSNNVATTYFYGVPGLTYIVQRSTNLSQGAAGWKAISTNGVTASGVITNADNFSDLSVPPYPAQSYYRLQTQ